MIITTLLSDTNFSSLGILTTFFVERLIYHANMASDTANMLSFAIKGTKIYLEEAKQIYNSLLSKTDNVLLSTEKIIINMATPEDALLFLR